MRGDAGKTALGALAFALVLVFIAWPLGAMLARSFVVTAPAPPAILAERARAALAVLDPADAARRLADAASRMGPRERAEAAAAAFALEGLAPPWDVTASFDRQTAAIDAALAALPPPVRAAVEADLPLATLMLHRRAGLAFAARERIAPEEFAALRSGVTTRIGLDHYAAVLTDARLRGAAAQSLKLALLTTTIATPLAFLVAWGLARGAVRGAGLARWAVLAPIVSPPVLVATAIVLLFGRNGLVTAGLLDGALGLIDADRTNLYGFGGVVVAQVLTFLPVAVIVFDSVLARQDPRLEEAAASLGASGWRRFRAVTLALAQPGFVRAGTLVFILSMTDFGNPMVVGRGMTVLAGALYDEMIGFSNTPLASAIAMWLIGPALIVYWLLGLIGRRKRFETPDAGPAAVAPPPAAVRAALTALVWGLVGLSALVYGAVALGAFVRVWGADWTLTLGHFTDAGAAPGFVSGASGLDPLWTSLRVALIAAPGGAMLGLLVAWLAERVGGWMNATTSFLVLTPAILPGVVFGVGYLVAFNAPLGIEALSLTGTHAVLALNILFGNMFVGVLAARAALRRLDRATEEAAESLGASLPQRLGLVVLPSMRRAAALGALYVFIDGLCTLSAVVFLQGPDIQLAAVAIFEAASASHYGPACALGLAVLGAAAVAMALARRLETAPRRAAPAEAAAA